MAMPERLDAPRNIVILGGGSAGWMTAAALTQALKGTDTTIQLVESEEIGAIGVGEATFPSIRLFNRLLGIDEFDFVQATSGSFKLGIEFVDWRVVGERYFHTFGDFGPVKGNTALWGQFAALRREAKANGNTARLTALGQLSDYCLPTVMARDGRFVQPSTDTQSLFSRYNYAYHFDASLYAGFLRKRAERQGCARIEGKVSEVRLRPDDGYIDALILSDGRELTGDLFIDCSGFIALLLNKTLNVPFVDYAPWLPVDGAWAMPTAQDSPVLAPYTRATALEAGWTWRIPLQHRTGNGYVFSSRFIDSDTARTRLMAAVGNDKVLAEPRLIQFRTGHRERFWEKNCVAIGLSGGFLEPLESTSIYLIQAGIARLIGLLPGHRKNPLLAREYNRVQVNEFERIRDFIILHYCLSERNDSEFWRHMRAMPLPDSLAYKIEIWRETGQIVMMTDEGFDEASWLAIYTGLGLWPRREDPLVMQTSDFAQLAQRRQLIAEGVTHLPSHEAFINRFCRASNGLRETGSELFAVR